MSKMHVIYHHPCRDGITSAYVFDYYMGEDGPVEYHPFTVTDKVNKSREFIKNDLFKGDEVYVLDFSFPIDVLREMAEVAGRVVVLDHHKTFREELGKPDDMKFNLQEENITIVYDNDKSGAQLVLDFVHSKFGVPSNRGLETLVSYVQDRDLWNWELPMSKYVNAYLDTFGYTILEMDTLHEEFNNKSVDEIADHGRTLFTAMDLRILKVLEFTRMIRFSEFPDVDIPCVNTPNDMSEVGDALLKRYPDAPFAAIYFQADGYEKWSLRARKGSDVDVSAIAKARGGGGHKSAAGFNVEWEGLELN